MQWRCDVDTLQVIPHFPPAWAYGGSPRSVFELSKELVAQGHRTTIYTSDACDATSRVQTERMSALPDGMKVHYFRNLSNSLAWRHRLSTCPGLVLRARRELGGFDVVHLHEYRTLHNVIVSHYARKHRVPYVLSARGSILPIVRKQGSKKTFDLLFGRRILRGSSRLIALSHKEAAQYEEMGLEADKVVVIPNGVDVAQYANLPPVGSFKRRHGLEDARMVLYLGRISRRKGLDTLIHAFANLTKARNDLLLVIAGSDFGYSAQCHALARRLEVSDTVVWPGLLVGEERLAALVDADVLAYPSEIDVFGRTPLEAIMCGTPVVLTGNCGVAEFLGPADAAYLVDHGDAEGLATMLNSVLDDPTEAKEKVRRGRDFIFDRLQWNAVAERIVAVYREATSGRPSPSRLRLGL